MIDRMATYRLANKLRAIAKGETFAQDDADLVRAAYAGNVAWTESGWALTAAGTLLVGSIA